MEPKAHAGADKDTDRASEMDSEEGVVFPQMMHYLKSSIFRIGL